MADVRERRAVGRVELATAGAPVAQRRVASAR